MNTYIISICAHTPEMMLEGIVDQIDKFLQKLKSWCCSECIGTKKQPWTAPFLVRLGGNAEPLGSSSQPEASLLQETTRTYQAQFTIVHADSG